MIQSDLGALSTSKNMEIHDRTSVGAGLFLGSLYNRQPLEQFILAFSALESVIHYFVGDAIVREANRQYEELIDIIKAVDDDGTRDHLMNFLSQKKGTLINPSLLQKFIQLSNTLYAASNSEEIEAFKRLNQLRNEVLHGRCSQIPDVPLFTSRGYTLDNPVSAARGLYIKYLTDTLHQRNSRG